MDFSSGLLEVIAQENYYYFYNRFMAPLDFVRDYLD